MKLLLSILLTLLGYATLDAQIVANEQPVEYIKVKRHLLGFKKYHNNGQMAETGWYKHGQPHGAWVCFDPEGHVVTQARYERGVKHGLWRFWDTQGNILCEVLYSYGKVVTAKQYDLQGAVVAAIGY